VAPSFAMIFFQSHLLAIIYFMFLRNTWMAIVLDWCPDNDNVIYKYLTEMIRLACDETPFLLVV
jgi:hypothetical protein